MLSRILPPPISVGRREIVLGVAGAGLALFLTEWVSRLALGTSHPWFIAPMGAAAVLLFALPASPLARPWPLVVGNAVSALVGVACWQWLGESPQAAALAVAGSVAAMFALRCVYPPAGAVALTAVLGGPAIHQLGYSFVLWPVLVNSLALGFLAVLVRRTLHLGQAHPRVLQPHQTEDPSPAMRLGYTREDLDAALASHGALLDIGRDDLEEILLRAHLHAGRRRWSEVRCDDVMSRDVVTVAPGDRVEEAWARIARHKVKALPVIDADRRVVGIVSLHDFFLRQGAGIAAGVPVIRPAHKVEEIMTRHVQVARPWQPMVDLVEGFSDGGLHHMPVIDSTDRLVGMVTQSDVVAALLAADRAVSPAGAAMAARPRVPARVVPKAVP